MLQLNRFQPENLAPPALERHAIGGIRVGERFQIFGGGNHFGGDAIGFAHLPQQHFQQFHRRSAIAAVVAVNPGQAFGVAQQAALNGRKNIGSRLRALHSPRKSPQIGQSFRRTRCGQRDLDQNIFLQHARARYVACLRLALAPGGKLHQQRQIPRLAGAVSKTLPGIFGVLLISRWRGQNPHFIGQPGQAARALQLRVERMIDVAQVRDIGNGIVNLRFRQRPTGPVGKAGGFVECHLANILGQVAVGNLVAKAADHGRHLRVKQRCRDHFGEIPDDLKILARGMEDFGHRLVGHQRKQRREVQALSQGIHRHRFLRAGQLHHAEFRPERRFAQKLGIYRNKIMAGQAEANIRQRLAGNNEAHYRSLTQTRVSG